MEIEVEGNSYRIGKIDARSQFHITRRLAPVLGEIAKAMSGGSTTGMDVLPPLAGAVANLSDDDSDYCLFGLLKVVTRKQPSGLGWGPVSTGNALMYDDINMATMMRLAWESFQVNLASFFVGLQSDLSGPVQKASDRSDG